MPSIVFLCVANSARSQMAEGLARAVAPPGWEVHSAGSQPSHVHPLAAEVMAEIGIDMSQHRSKGLAEVPLASADVVVTLCAEEECPVSYTSGVRLAWPMPDPAAPAPSDEEQRSSFRAVRDRIRDRVEAFWREHRG